MRTVHVFVYGTLMHGHGLMGWASDAEVAEPQEATVPGVVYDTGSIPYADFVAAPVGRVVHGEVLTMDPTHPAYERVVYVESGAGYRPIEVLATLSTGQTLVCEAWNCTDREREYLRARGYPIVEDGDWGALDEQRHALSRQRIVGRRGLSHEEVTTN